MSVSALLLVFFSISVSTALVWTAHELKTRHQARYLDHYYHFILASVCYGMVNWVGPFLILDIAGSDDPRWIIGSFIVFAAPLLFVKLGFIIFLFQELMMRDVARRALQVFTMISGLTLIACLLVIKGYLDSGESNVLRTFMQVLGAVAVAIEFAAIGQFLIHGAKKRTSAIAEASLQFGALYLAGQLIYVAVAWSPYVDAPLIIFDASPWIYFLVHVMPLAVLWKFHKNAENTAAENPVRGERDLVAAAQDFGLNFGLTKREREILRHVMKGQSNQEISEALFISPNTVRNHIYNIYGKMGVKNRLQLVAQAAAPQDNQIG